MPPLSFSRIFAPTAILFFVFLQACATHQVPARHYSPGFTQKGIASWYGPGFHGKRTANGETYNMHHMTAAHKTLPMGSLVRVHSLTSGQNITVRINDRGPFVKGRIIDLSYQAARDLGIVQTGIDTVQITLIEVPSSPKKTTAYWVQAGSFSTQKAASRFSQQLGSRYGPTRIIHLNIRGQGDVYRVQIGKFKTKRAARASAERLKSDLGIQPSILTDA